VGRDDAERRRHVEYELGHQGEQVVALERSAAGQDLEQHAAQREHVRGRRGVRLSPGLLGRHVPGRAEDGAGLGHPPRTLEQRDPEIEHP
jgi:hypothetical protein